MYQPKLGDRVEYRREIGRVTDVDPETGDLIIKCVDYVLVPLGDQMSVSRGSLAWRVAMWGYVKYLWWRDIFPMEMRHAIRKIRRATPAMRPIRG
jgi:hypothetical protein